MLGDEFFENFCKKIFLKKIFFLWKKFFKKKFFFYENFLDKKIFLPHSPPVARIRRSPKVPKWVSALIDDCDAISVLSGLTRWR